MQNSRHSVGGCGTIKRELSTLHIRVRPGEKDVGRDFKLAMMLLCDYTIVMGLRVLILLVRMLVEEAKRSNDIDLEFI